ncbi:MAG: tyrosine-protein phosphatase [Prevotella sp.]|nr:tyrosine-protein phosphatase [Prevotella sp.]
MENEIFATAIVLFGMTFAAQVAHSQRAIAFSGIENARDIGTLVMQNGQTVRAGMLVRSGNLSQATDGDVVVLKGKYHLTDVFDFRLEAEANAAPDRIIDGVSYIHLSTLPKALIEGFASSDSSDMASMDKKGMMETLLKYAMNPKAQSMARQLYPIIVTDSTAQHYYGAFLRGVLRAEGGVLWHCSQGKDRAGWASAFLLAALGASREVIVEDFDLSNQSYARQVEAMTAKVRDAGGNDEAVAFMRAMIGVSRENFESTLDLIDQRYGSLSQYIENLLGFSKEEQQQLRKKYLISE